MQMSGTHARVEVGEMGVTVKPGQMVRFGRYMAEYVVFFQGL